MSWLSDLGRKDEQPALPLDNSNIWFIGPPLSSPEPRREVTETERAHIESFLSEVKEICAKYNLTIASYDEYGIAIVEGAERSGFAFCTEIWTITAQEVEGLRWD